MDRFEFFGVGRIVGPKREDTARVQLRGKGAQAIGLVEGSIARVQQIARRMIDIQQHGVKAPSGLFRIEPVC